MEIVTDSPEETREIAAMIAGMVEPGDIVLLSGELGAGKTVFVQGLAGGLGYRGQVTSPTFVLVQHYEGRIPIVHADMYRLSSLEEIRDLGLAEIGAEGVTVVEWGEAAAPILPDEHLDVEIDVTGSEQRRLTIVARGDKWAARLPRLEKR